MRLRWSLKDLASRPCFNSTTASGHQEVLTKMDVVVKEIDDLMTSQLSAELQDWKRRQQIAAIGGPLLTSLDLLQNW